jgi:aminomethyltransferase
MAPAMEFILPLESALPQPDNTLLHTPLHDLHLTLGARLVPFAGYAMPVQYPAGLMAEHRHTRTAASLFDVSHMGQLRLVGPDAAAALEQLMPMDVIDLPVGRQRYGLLLNDEGGIIDDLMFIKRGGNLTGGRASRQADARGGDMSAAGPPQGAMAPSGGSESRTADERGGDIFIVVNGACKAGDIAHIKARIGSRCQVIPLPERALLALQGPQAVSVLQRLSPGIEKLVFLSGGQFRIAGSVPGSAQDIDCFITRSGYTGEDGFEISVHEMQAEALAHVLLAQAEVQPAGLGARNSLRLEAGLCLYGNDIDASTTPVEAGLGWAIPKVRRAAGARAGGFPGAIKILAQLENGTRATGRKRVGLVALERIPVRDHSELQSTTGQRIGEVTSGLLGPTLDRPVAMGYVTAEFAALGTRINAIVRGKPVPMEVSAMPFVPHHYFRG